MSTESTAVQTIETRVKNVLAEQLGIAFADIKNENHIADDLDADSLDSIELVMALEDEFEMEIADEVAEEWSTVQKIIDGVTKLNPTPR